MVGSLETGQSLFEYKMSIGSWAATDDAAGWRCEDLAAASGMVIVGWFMSTRH